MTRFQRRSEAGGEQRTTPLELFYDLVLVFAITQISHHLLAHLTWTGLAQAVVLLLVVWWAWNYTAWVTNELDLESTPIRLLVLAIMLASLLLTVSVPGAFGGRAFLFAGSYVAIQVGRHLFLTFATATAGTIERERAGRILAWFICSGVFWLAGAAVDGRPRAALWAAALAVDYAAPLVTYWVPGRRRLSGDTWEVGAEHFAERFQLFVIIALGETIVVTGATTAGLELGVARLTAFALAFVSTAALWWLYFDYVARIAQRRLELASVADRTLLARDAYTYLHALVVAGIIAGAVGDGLVIAHPTTELPGREIAAVVAGPALYLLAHALFRLRMTGSPGWKRLAGAAACVAVAAVGPVAPALVLALLLVVVLVAVIASEYAAGARRRRRGDPSPLERLEATARG